MEELDFVVLKNLNEYDGEVQKIWTDDEFWNNYAKRNYPNLTKSDDQTWLNVIENTESNIKPIRVSANRKKYGNIFVSPKTTLEECTNYAITLMKKQPADLENDEKSQLNFTLHLYPWLGGEKNIISGHFSSERSSRSNAKLITTTKSTTKSKSTKSTNSTQSTKNVKSTKRTKNVKSTEVDEVLIDNIPEYDYSDEEWQAKIFEEFNKTFEALPEGFEQWSEIYELLSACLQPKEEWTAGCKFDAIMDHQGNSIKSNYGYAVQIKSEMKGRPKHKIPTEITLRRFDDGQEEIWTWTGTSTKGHWQNAAAIEKMKSEGKNTRQREIKNLKPNTSPFPIEF